MTEKTKPPRDEEIAYNLGKRAAVTEFQQGDKDTADQIREQRNKVVDRAHKTGKNK